MNLSYFFIIFFVFFKLISLKDQNFVKDPTPKKNTDEGIFGDIKRKLGTNKKDDKKKDEKKK